MRKIVFLSCETALKVYTNEGEVTPKFANAIGTTPENISLFKQDYRAISEACTERGVVAVFIPWDKAIKYVRDNSDVVACVVQSPWDYIGRLEDFKSTLKALAALGMNVLNKPSMVIDNLDKSYLLKFEKIRIPIIETVLVNPKEVKDIYFLEKKGWNEVVLKPSISSGGQNVFIAKSLAQAQYIYEQLQLERPGVSILLQPLIPEIKDGELSFVFFNGVYSHMIVRKPEAEAQGAESIKVKHKKQSADEYKPTLEQLEQVKAIYEKIKKYYGEDLTLVRIDSVFIDGNLYVMEIELTDPHLYLEDFEAIPLFLNAILNHELPFVPHQFKNSSPS